ncbi:MAG: CotH kinase family protein [Planctomycetes bacterium]|nr:CotH kinase family protein [Planctomycetota bacterium]
MWSWAKPSAPAAILWLAAAAPAFAQRAPKDSDGSEALFKGGQVPRLVIELDDAAEEHLRLQPRSWVQGRLRENDRTVFEGVSFKLKGSAGSFRQFDDHPSFTIRMDKRDRDQEFHGLRKFHLNNSVQDDSHLRELLGSELFRAAGVLTPRVTHARVWIGRRDAGVYVLKEGFDTVLLKRGFEKATGNLYDGGFCRDIDTGLERDEGFGPNDGADLRNLVEACREPDPVRRSTRLAEALDIKSFITVMAMELMLGHWDGYCQNRNNYRIYFEPDHRKAFFLPHGMDQIFEEPDAPILDPPVALAADAVMKNPAWRADYRKEIARLLPLFNANRLRKRIDELEKHLAPAFQGGDPEASSRHKTAVNELKNGLEARERSLREQSKMPDPKPIECPPNVPVRLKRWRTNSECEDASLTTERSNGVEVLRIKAGNSGRCIASYRCAALLDAGKYRFQAILSVKDVVKLEEGSRAPGLGAGLRISGSTRTNGLTGTVDFRPVVFEFEIREESRNVELVVELRSSRGQVAVRTDSLTLTKLK